MTVLSVVLLVVAAVVDVVECIGGGRRGGATKVQACGGNVVIGDGRITVWWWGLCRGTSSGGDSLELFKSLVVAIHCLCLQARSGGAS